MPDHDPEVTPEQEARLRRLLAQARHGEPVPVDVAGRLDRVLEALASEGPDPDAGRSVVDLAARRRRRVTTLLVAAAAVVVVGVGVGQITRGSQGDDASSASTADSPVAAADESSAGDAGGFDKRLESHSDYDAEGGNAAQSPDGSSSLGAPTPDSAPRPPVRLTSEAFAKQAVRYRDRPGVESSMSTVVTGEELSLSEDFVCDTADWGEGALLAALYDGVPTVLAYRPLAGETQTVDLLRCGTGEVLRSTVLPVEG